MKLTAVENRALEAANRSGGVVGLGRYRQAIRRLRERGLLSRIKDEHGYYSITDAGRAAFAAANPPKITGGE